MAVLHNNSILTPPKRPTTEGEQGNISQTNGISSLALSVPVKPPVEILIPRDKESDSSVLHRNIVDINAKDQKGNSYIHLAIINDDEKTLSNLLKHEKIKVNETSADALTPLHLAIKLGRNNLVEILLNHPKIDINKIYNEGNTALHLAIEAKNENLVSLLLEKKADFNIKNRNKKNAYSLAIAFKFYDISKMIYRFANTPLHTAVGSYSLQIVKDLLADPKTNVNAKDEKGNTALYLAVKRNNLEIFKELLKREDLDVNSQNIEGNTAFHLAILLDRLEMVDILLNHRLINLNIVNDGKISAIELVLINNYKDLSVFKRNCKIFSPTLDFETFKKRYSLLKVVAGVWGVNESIKIQNLEISSPAGSSLNLIDIFLKNIKRYASTNEKWSFIFKTQFYDIENLAKQDNVSGIFFNKFSLTDSLLSKRIISMVLPDSKIEEDIKVKKIPVCISYGKSSHYCNIIFWKNYLVICDKNNGSPVFIYNKDKLVPGIIQFLNNQSFSSPKEMLNFLFLEFPRYLDGQITVETKILSQTISKYIKKQKVGNCGYSNAKFALQVLRILEEFDKIPLKNQRLILELVHKIHQDSREDFFALREFVYNELIKEFSQEPISKIPKNLEDAIDLKKAHWKGKIDLIKTAKEVK